LSAYLCFYILRADIYIGLGNMLKGLGVVAKVLGNGTDCDKKHSKFISCSTGVSVTSGTPKNAGNAMHFDQ